MSLQVPQLFIDHQLPPGTGPLKSVWASIFSQIFGTITALLFMIVMMLKVNSDVYFRFITTHQRALLIIVPVGLQVI